MARSSDIRDYHIEENEKVITEKVRNATEDNLLHRDDVSHTQRQEIRSHEHDDGSSFEKGKLEETEIGVSKETNFLPGPSPYEHSLFSNHSCSCHSLTPPIYGDPTQSMRVRTSTKSDEKLSSCSTDSHRQHDEIGDFESCDGRIFYLVSIHNDRTLADALFLFRAIRDTRNTILIHIDVKFGFESYYNSPLHKEIEACPCGSKVEVDSIYDCKWGSWSMNLPTLWSMKKAVNEYAGKWDVFINLSGDTMPVYSQNRVAHLFGGPLRGINFVTSIACETGLIPTSILEFPKHWHKRTHYSHLPPTNLKYVDDDGVIHDDAEVEIFFGSQWVSLTPQFCKFLVRALERPDSLPSRFRDWLIDTEKLMADETFFTSMLMRYFRETIPKIKDDFFINTTNTNEVGAELSMYAIRYERMDEHVPTSKGYFPTEQRYEVPPSTGMEQPKPWGPYFLGIYDLENIRLSGALYIRKVARMIDPNIYKFLPVDIPEQIPPISWPTDVKISPVPDWEKTLLQYRKRSAK